MWPTTFGRWVLEKRKKEKENQLLQVLCGKFKSPDLGEAQQPEEQRYPFLSVCAVSSCVHRWVWLAVFGIRLCLTPRAYTKTHKYIHAQVHTLACTHTHTRTHTHTHNVIKHTCTLSMCCIFQNHYFYFFWTAAVTVWVCKSGVLTITPQSYLSDK